MSDQWSDSEEARRAAFLTGSGGVGGAGLLIRAATASWNPYSFETREVGMNLSLEVEQEEDGRWLAEVVELPGALAYGASADEAMVKAEALALRALAEQLEHGEASPLSITIAVPTAA